jgi:uncharacterized delta-60 repeat protein
MRKVQILLAQLRLFLGARISFQAWRAVCLLSLALPVAAQTGGTFSFATNRFAVSETDGLALIVITRTSDVGVMMVDLVAENGTATNGVDFVLDPATNTITFSHFQTAVTVAVDITDNDATNQAGQVAAKFSLVNPRPGPAQPATLEGKIATRNNTAQLVILDDDRELEFNLEASRFFVQEPPWTSVDSTNATTITINVVLATAPGDTSQGVEVDYSVSTRNYTRPGSDFATPGADYEPITLGTLTFGPNDTVLPISITITNDNELEFNEDFHVTLTEARGSMTVDSADGPVEMDYAIGKVSEATVTILFNAQPTASKPAGAVDLLFNPDNSPVTTPPFNSRPGANNSVSAVAHDNRGNIIIGGNFSAYNATTRTRIARVRPDGLLDETFRPDPGANDFVRSLVVYTNGPLSGKVLVAGGFTAVNGAQRNGVARLNAEDGSIDPTFDPGSGANGPVYTVALQRDGGILLGGDFTIFNGVPRQRLVRLTSDGQVDLSFDSSAGANGPVYAIWPRSPDPLTITNALTNGLPETFIQDIDVGASSGFLTLTYNFYAESNNIIVLSGTNILHDSGLIAHEVISTNSSGALETNYVPSVVSFEFSTANNLLTFIVNTLTNAASNWIFTASIQANNSLGAYIGGDFTTYSNTALGRVALLNNDGSIEPGFAAASGLGADDTVFALAMQQGRLVLGGAFDSFNSFAAHGLAALNPDGSFDRDFAIGTGAEDGDVLSLFVLGDSTILVGGSFTRFNQSRRTFLTRLLPEGPVDTSFLDTAFNQFAGFPNSTGFAPSGEIRAISVDTNANVVVGGAFSRVGGGISRVDFRPRNNLARLHGGSTPGPGNVDLFQPIFGADEDAGLLSLVLRRENGTRGAASITLKTIDGAATSLLDYLPHTNTLVTWPIAGPSQSDGIGTDRLQPVVIVDDAIVEGNENFQILLSAPLGQFTLGGEFIPAGLALGEISSARGLIVENDVPSAVFDFIARELDVNEGDRQVIVDVIRSGDVSSSVSVAYATLINTNTGFATANLDYTTAAGTLTFTSGQTKKSFTLLLADDAQVEQDEGVDLLLSAPSVGAVIGTNGSARLNIVDNDYAPGRVSFASTNYTVTESAPAQLTVCRTGGNVGVLRVNYSTFDGTATVPFDFEETAGVLQWDDGDTSTRTILVNTSEDGLVEGPKQFSVRLFGSAALGVRTNAIVTILDNDSVGSFSFNAPEILADENGTNIIVTVVRRGGASGPASVDFATEAVSAVPGVDYEQVVRTLLFGDGETSQSITLPIFDDLLADGEKQVRLVLANPQPGTLGLLTNALLSIIDNESFNIPAGSVETDFAVGAGANGAVHAIALHPDGRFYLGGDFTLVNHQVRTRLARLNPDGALDPDFGLEYSINGPVRALDIQSDGRVLIAGGFTEVDSSPFRYLARITAGGTLDQTFNIGSGADNPIFAVKETTVGGGKAILIGGSFSMFNGVPRRGLARVTSDGRTDLAFDPGAGVNGNVLAIEVQRDGKILIGGEFTSVDGVSRINVARLNADGSLDRTFDAGLGADGSVRSIVIQFDDRILLGGLFTSVAGVDRRHIARIFSDGTFDSSFDPGTGADSAIYALGLQPDGRILLAGDFSSFNGVPVNRLVRLNPDGSIDTGINFGRGANALINALVVQPDRRILIGGAFTEVDGLVRNRFARLYGGSISGAGRIEFSSAVFSTSENVTNLVVTVRRSGGLEGAVSVDYLSRANTASPGVDYTDVRGSLAFAPGENSRSFSIPLVDDNLAEPNEFVSLVLTNVAGGATLGNQPVAMVSIVSDDSVVNFTDVAYSISEGAPGGRAVIHISREGDTLRPASVVFSASQGTALPGEDFNTLSTTINLPAGESSASVTVQVLNDTIVEDAESVVLRLTSPGPNTGVGRAAAALTILDDDVAPGILDVLPISAVSEGSRTVVATITRSSGKTGFVSVQYSVRNGSANAGADYIQNSGTIFFLDGETVKSVTITIVDDDVIEGNETFIFEISNPANGALIGADSATAVILDDDLPSGSVDSSFNPGAGPNGPVRALKFALNNRLLIGGEFTSVNGVPRSRIARLNPGGALDSTFSAEPGPDGIVSDLELDPDGRIILAGDFNTVQTALLNRVARLNPSGTLDLTFALPLGFNAGLSDAARQPDGKIVLGGMFDIASAAGRNRIARIHADGTLDLQFNPGSGADNNVAAVVLQDEKILIGGSFLAVSGVEKRGLARLHSDGAVDTTFNRNGAGVSNGVVNKILLLGDGRVLIGGAFSGYNGAPRNGVALLDRDGNLQAAFNPGTGPNGPVRALAQQEDGKFLIAGDFTAFAGQARGRIARLNPNGSLDPVFAPGSGFNGPVLAMLIQPADGKIIAAGRFTAVDNEPRPFIARLNNDKAFVQNRTVTFTPLVRSQGQLRLTVNTQAGFTYTLESAASLPGPWIRAQSVVAEGPTVTFTATPESSRQFFRIRRE